MSGDANRLNKVINKDYLFRQFQAYNNLNKQFLRALDRKLARLYLRIDEMQTVLNQNNITVDFTDIDALTDEEIDELFEENQVIPSITITGDSTVEAGDTITLVSDVNDVTWSSSNSLIASVTQAGVVEGLDEGTVVITATKNGYIDGTKTVTVTSSEPNGGGGNPSEE